ncbi:MAG: hypothetical protein LBE81_06020 [Azonexus sp.]|jgi:hypothetical protein|uniref:hypothetical protein n=1 Tax=Azonexus sp. TaxID=1872668 RepID=UPI002833F2D9|nr:hypothetical protein [Azonexus sp.]MDR0776179.1 hypothetical protein [Azonexus sp.]
MKRLCLTTIFALLGSLAGAPVHAADSEDEMPDAQKIRYCKRIRDHAIQALYSRDGGTPMKLYEEDGSNGPRIINVIIRHIYAEPKIATPQQAETFGLTTCHEMMGLKGGQTQGD